MDGAWALGQPELYHKTLLEKKKAEGKVKVERG